MTDFADIYQAVETILSNLADLPEHVVWPNDSFEPGVDDTYIEVVHIPVGTVAIGMEDSGSFRRDFILELDIYTPKGQNQKDCLALAKSISQQFAKSERVSTDNEGYRIQPKYSDIGQGSVMGAHYRLPVLIHYVAITA